MKILIFITLIILFIMYDKHIVINFKSFFKKGFKVNDDKFGCYAFCGKQRFSVRL